MRERDMRKNKQRVFDIETGDCFRACMSSLLGIANTNGLPHIDKPSWFSDWRKFLLRYGLALTFEKEACWRSGYWIASVKSKNFPKTTHAIVMHHSKVWHDPSTKKRYRAGRSLLGKDIVVGGYFLEVVDPSKLKIKITP